MQGSVSRGGEGRGQSNPPSSSGSRPRQTMQAGKPVRKRRNHAATQIMCPVDVDADWAGAAGQRREGCGRGTRAVARLAAWAAARARAGSSGAGEAEQRRGRQSERAGAPQAKLD